jgi:hypothetical protein
MFMIVVIPDFYGLRSRIQGRLFASFFRFEKPCCENDDVFHNHRIVSTLNLIFLDDTRLGDLFSCWKRSSFVEAQIPVLLQAVTISDIMVATVPAQSTYGR